MHEYILKFDQLAVNAIHASAKRSKMSEQEYIKAIVESHQDSLNQFPEGVIRSGCGAIITLLSQIPCLDNFEYSGVDFRYWWVSFDLDRSSPIAWAVIRRLGWYLNTQSVEMSLPAAFMPIPDESPDQPLRWTIKSTAPRFDPADVAEWLSEHLPQPISSQDSWLEKNTN